ncbi:MAG: Zn-dependent alcohol dehydrogenase [Dehalococcoidia bacterium]|nr:Zn-dependent alcohol dehydrogenase [Dehalococcoidia bacterium]
MKAAVCYEPNTPLRIEEVELDSPQANEILVRIAATGICHSDLHFLKGEMPAAMPIVMGHEGAGIVEEVGPGVTSLKPGDHVVMAVAFSCGNCSYCREGRPTMCVENLPVMSGAVLPVGGGTRLHKDGKPLHHLFGLASFAEYTVIHERSAIKVRNDAPFEVVCLLGCGVSTGLGAAMNTAAVKPGESIAIFGCGGVGLSAVMGAKLAGAGKIIAVDMLDRKLSMAKELGADYTVNASQEEPVGKVMEITGSGVDYAIECIGNVNVMSQAFSSIRYGGKCIVAGMAPLGAMFSVAPFEFLLGKTITGTVQGDIRGAIDIPRYIDLYMDGKLPLDKLISSYYTLEEVNQAFEALGKGEIIRSIIRFPKAGSK